MQYILEDKFQSIYLQFGNNKHMTLGLANTANVHPTVKYISVEQFENDIPYLYNALKHSIRGRGADLIVQAQSSQDGIVVYKNLTQRYRYGGDVDTYKSKLLNIIHGDKYRTGYPGGPLVYLDQWENAVIRYNKMADQDGELRSAFLIDTFALKFKAVNDTEHIFEQARDNTENFDELANALRMKLAQRNICMKWMHLQIRESINCH